MYTISYKIRNKDVNMYREMRTSRLMEMLQEICISHTQALGAGREKTLDKGILWVVIQQHVDITRMPVYDEEIQISTWPGKTMHVLFPRYFRISSANEGILISGSAMWTLIDQTTRKMIFADQAGIDVPGEVTGLETPLPKPVHQRETDNTAQFKVPFSYCDMNGHMNNARYFDLAEDFLPIHDKHLQLVSFTTQYAEEIRFNELVKLAWKQEGNSFYFTGDKEKNCFRMELEYQEKTCQ